MKIFPVQIFGSVKQITPQNQAVAALNFGNSGGDSFRCGAVKDIEWMFKDSAIGEKVVGRSTLRDKKTGEKIDVAITCAPGTLENEKSYFVYELKKDYTNEYLGYVRVMPSECQGEPSAFIQKMAAERPKAGKGVGTLLHQIAIERSIMTGCGGRVHFDKDYDSELFHYKCGFRVYDTGSDNAPPEWRYSTPEEINLAIRAEIRRAKEENDEADTEDKLGEYGEFKMYLPCEAIAQWKEIIAQSPCLLVKH